MGVRASHCHPCRPMVWVCFVAMLFGFAAAANAQEATDLAYAQPTTLRGDPAHAQVFRFIALAGDKFSIKVTGAPTSLTLYDVGGNPMLNASSDAPELTVTAPADGVYFASVLATSNRDYRVQLTRLFKAAPAPLPLDPAWGVYTRLAGRAVQADAGYRIGWRWEADRKVLVEEWFHPRTLKIVFTAQIEPGPTIGVLRWRDRGRVILGQIAADGTVAWDAGGFLQPAFRVRLGEEGEVRYEILDKSGALKRVIPYAPADRPGG